MAVRRFDNTDDELRVGTSTAALTGAYTIAVVFDLEGGDAGWHSFIGFFDTSGNYRLGVVRDTSNKIRIDGHQGSPSFQQSSTSFVAADGHTLLVITKATGAATPTFHFIKQGAGSMTHEAAAGALGNMLTSSGGTVRFGAFTNGDPMNSLLSRAAVWDGTAFDNTQCEGLVGGTKAAWAALSPTHLWQFDQAATTDSVLDEIGSADQTALTGTAVVTTSDPPTSIITLGGGSTDHTQPEADTASLTDAVAKTVGLTLADTASLADAVDNGHGLTQTVDDTVSLTDATAADIGVTVADAPSLTDSVVKAPAVNVADDLDVSDTGGGSGKSASVTLDDSIDVSDAVDTGGSTAHTKTLADTASLVDATGKGVQLAHADTASLTDSTVKAVGVVLSDAGSLADSRVRVWATSRTVGDALALTDSVTNDAVVVPEPDTPTSLALDAHAGTVALDAHAATLVLDAHASSIELDAHDPTLALDS